MLSNVLKVYYTHLTDEETETVKLSTWLQVTQVVSRESGFKSSHQTLEAQLFSTRPCRLAALGTHGVPLTALDSAKRTGGGCSHGHSGSRKARCLESQPDCTCPRWTLHPLLPSAMLAPRTFAELAPKSLVERNLLQLSSSHHLQASPRGWGMWGREASWPRL